MFLDQDEYRVATFSDVTESKTLARVEQQNSVLTMLQSSVSHEMMAPLRCIVNFAQVLERELKHSPRQKEAQLISMTAKLLLAEVKMLLDKNLMENNRFEADYAHHPLNRVVADIIELLRFQASLKQVRLKLIPLASETIVKIDL